MAATMGRDKLAEKSLGVLHSRIKEVLKLAQTRHGGY
jgi:hypothetical protein